MEQCPDRGEDTFARTIRRKLYSCRCPLPQFSCGSSRFSDLELSLPLRSTRTTTPRHSSASHIGHSIVEIFRPLHGQRADRTILAETQSIVSLSARQYCSFCCFWPRLGHNCLRNALIRGPKA